MAFTLVNRALETTQTEGTGAYTLEGAVNNSFIEFAEGMGDGDETYYCVQDDEDFEIGRGTFSAGTGPDSKNQIVRTTVLESSNGGAAVDWLSGTRNIFSTIGVDGVGWLGDPLAETGFVVQTSSSASARRTITASGGVSVQNGSGVSGNPSITFDNQEITGATGQTGYVAGDILYADATDSLDRLGIGAEGTSLRSVSGIPSWVNPATIKSESTPYTVLPADNGKTVLITGTGTVTLPLVSTVSPGYIVTIVNISSGTVTVSTTGGVQTISGELTQSLSDQWSGYRIVCDGSNWVIEGLAAATALATQASLNQAITDAQQAADDAFLLASVLAGTI